MQMMIKNSHICQITVNVNEHNPCHANQYGNQHCDNGRLFKSMNQINESRSDNKELHVNTQIPRLRHCGRKIGNIFGLAKFFYEKNRICTDEETLEYLQHLDRRMENVVCVMTKKKRERERKGSNLEFICCDSYRKCNVLRFPRDFHSFVYAVMCSTNVLRNVLPKTISNMAKMGHCRENGTLTLLQV